MSARVESQADPRTPGRTAYRISGTTPDAVQAEITRLMNLADAGCGMASFIGPKRVDDGFGALGFVTIPEAA